MRLFAIVLIFLLSCAGQAEISIEQTKTIPLSDAEIFSLSASPAKGNFAEHTLSLLAYNNQVPGPIFRVKQGSTAVINFTNNLDQETLVHWHGIRVDNEYDGMHLVQNPIKPGESFEYHLKFPDDGIYWYHPHINEPEQQERGLYGAILVEPLEPYPSADYENVLFLDDIRLWEGDIEPFEQYTTYAMMGRFGTDMFINGKQNESYSFETGTIARFFVINAANTRTFNFSIQGAKMKVIGSDSGRYESEFFTDSVVLSPSERAIIDIAFEKPGTYFMLNRNPYKTYKLASIKVVDGLNESEKFRDLAKGPQIPNFTNYENKTPDYELVIESEMHGMNHAMMMSGGEPIEWEDTMQMMNARSTSQNTKWILRDKKSGKENMDFTLNAKKDSFVKVRITNPSSGMHPMQHPIHIHGQRFVILGEKNQVWKDTVLVPAGKSVDILVDFSNPGEWMMHCHISEHLEAGMSINVNVTED